jgi:phosphonate C-P lyase system protein PhnH
MSAPAAPREIERHRAFRATLLAMSYPGRVQAGPCAGRADAGKATAQLIAEACDLPVVRALPAETIAALPRGTEEEPELGATLILAPEPGVAGSRVRISGPGVAAPFDVEIPLAPAALAQRNLACEEYPLGIDLIFALADGSCLGLPRTTRAELVVS